ncbi:hypothetical protein Rhal01_01614 [Rubritalea halochordaticola]|uniref:Ice-binding protein C-terminal domain-containing protein n=1 Tax=Rubritalea halochordaticola TaxID=714537 RepID=A0ABP9V1G6_9BACT
MKTHTQTLLAVAAMTCSGYAATTLTNQVLVNFGGSISGNDYTLGSGEVDTTGTFTGFGSPVVSSGEADLTGGSTHQGFNFDPTSLGSLTSQNWVVETRVSFDAFNTGQRTILDVNGDTDFRINNGGSLLEMVYWDGGQLGSQTTALPGTGEFVHIAMVWDAAASSLTGYVDGVAIGTIDNNAFATPDANNVSFGYFGRNGFDNRGIDGQLDSVAFSTFTGSFDANTDFQIAAVPEPSTSMLVGLSGMLVLLRRRR